MPETLQSVLIALAAVVPGAVMLRTFRKVNLDRLNRRGTSPDSFNDRVLGYLTFSAFLAPMTITLIFRAHDWLFQYRDGKQIGRVETNDLNSGDVFWSSVLIFWLYLAVPALLGALAALLVRLSQSSSVRAWFGRGPLALTYATGWDAIFLGLEGETGVVRWRVAGEKPYWQAWSVGEGVTRHARSGGRGGGILAGRRGG